MKHMGAVFKPVRFEFGKMHISGGYTWKPMAMVTKTTDDRNGKQQRFVKMAATEQWLIMSTCGSTGKNNSRHLTEHR